MYTGTSNGGQALKGALTVIQLSCVCNCADGLECVSLLVNQIMGEGIL